MSERVAASRLPRRVAARGASARPNAEDGVLGSRVLAFLIDSLVLGIFVMAVVGVATALLLVQTDGGFEDASNSALWTFTYICLGSVPAWALALLVLLRRRGQTPGQYILGIEVRREDGEAPTTLDLLLYFAAMHPLVFHPLVSVFWFVAAFVTVSKIASDAVFIGFVAVSALCAIGPLVALAAAGPDHGRRALHDRVAGLKVVRLE